MVRKADAGAAEAVAQQTLERRSVLQWLGTGLLLPLSSPLLRACLSDQTAPEPSVPIDHPTGPFDFPFAPGPEDLDLWGGWTVFTVDPQDLAEILATWTVTVDGLVADPRTYGFADLIALPREDPVVDFHCVTGWSVHDMPWNGVHLSQLLNPSGVLPEATHLTFHTLGDTYNESLPLGVALEPKTLLAYGVAGFTLPLAHGFPLRLVVPRLQGYKSAKYVYRIEVTDHPVDGYWEQRGYSYDAEVPPDRLRDGKY